MTALGNDIADVLKGSWRRTLVRRPLSSRLDQIVQILLSTGSAGLAWRQPNLVESLPASLAANLQEVYRHQLLRAAVHDLEVTDIFKRTRRLGIEPILFKGWSLAQKYPDPGLRPYGDLDLWVPPEELKLLYSALPSRNEYIYSVEPHDSFYPQFERSFDDVMNNSQFVPLNDIQVRVPCDEDHLRFICLHFLYHGGWRPLWLCDVALMIETAGSDFDWDRCLRGKRKHADWIACVIGLAHQLLGAEVSGIPVAKRAKSLPRWLSNAVLAQWGKGPGMSSAENLSFSFPRRLLKPTALARSFREHWRNPIQASVEMNAWFNEFPRGLLQFSSVFLRIPEFVRYFGREIRRT
jgi:hypothetical protein